MKKFILSVISMLLICLPVFAADGLVAVKTEDGVFLSWKSDSSVQFYSIYKNGEVIAETGLTNYFDKGADGSASYSVGGAAVSVWENQYLEIPVSAPVCESNAGTLLKGVRISVGEAQLLGGGWSSFGLEDGSVVFVNGEGKVIDVNAQSKEVGGKVGVYAFNNGDNQKFYIEDEDGGSVIKGKQSNLYLNVSASGDVTLAEKASASVFTIEYTEAAASEAAAAVAEALSGKAVYSANDASVGDLDGDGEPEIVLKWDPSDSKDASQQGKTGKVYIDAYKLNGTRLWRIDLGKNIRAGAHDTQFLVYDLDGDGAAEVAFRTADGTVDGVGNAIGDPNADWTGNWSGKNLEGPLWVSVFNGKTGALEASVPFDPQSNEPSTLVFGDDYGNRSERYNACVAYLDGENPYMVFQRGYYGGREGKGPGRTVIAAYSYKNKTIEKYWRFDTMDSGNEKYIGQGNHNISVGDCDNDGKDEIFTGALTLDHDGSVLWCSFMGHGDAMHLGDFDPFRRGLEYFAVHEESSEKQKFGFTVFAAENGDVLQFREAGKDTGRGLIANIAPFGGTYTAWAGSGAGKINSLGENIDAGFNSMNFRIYWDGDLYDELLDGTSIFKVNAEGEQELLFNAAGCASNNGSKATPCFQGDIFGDWREEVIWRTADNSALRIYTTAIPTPYRIAPLTEDHVYRMGLVWQNSSYNQPPHLGYYIGGDIVMKLDSARALLNGQPATLDAAPYIENGRTLVPLRFIAEGTGAGVEYDSGIITVSVGDKTVVMNVGSREYSVNGETKAMETVPVIVNSRTMVPVRAVSEALGMNVEWDGENRLIKISMGVSSHLEGIDMSAFEAAQTEAVKGDVKIFIAGDSTAQSYRDNMAPQAGWGQMLGMFFDSSVTVENRAMAGRSLKSFFDEGRWSSILSDASAGDYVIIQFGHNDGAYNKPERYLSYEDFSVMLENEYIRPALEKGLRPIIATQTQSHWFDEATGKIGEPSAGGYAALLRDAAKEFELPLLEINNLSRALENEMGEEKSRALHLYAEPGEYERYPDGVKDNTHFSYTGAFEIAKIAASELCQIADLKNRRADEYSVIAAFSGEYGFDVRPYAMIGNRFRVAIRSAAPVNVKLNGKQVLTSALLDREFICECTAENGRITVESDGEITAEVSPVWEFAPEGGINTASAEFYAAIPDGTYDFRFTKSDNRRGNIYVNSLLVGANVDMYGTVGVPEGTVYNFNGFELNGGASVKVDQKTTSLKAVKAAKTPSVFKRKTRIYIAGDSTLCSYYPIFQPCAESEIKPGTVRTGWGQLLDRFTSDKYEVVNLASSGDWARDWRDCIFPTVKAQGKSGDMLIIQFGINDRNRDDKSRDTMKTALTDMIEGCREKGIIPVLVKPQPSVGYSWGSAGENERPNGSNGGFFDAVKEVADETGCDYVDLYSLAAEHFAEVGRSYVARNYQLWDYEKNDMADKLHLSFDGAKTLAALFARGAEGLIEFDGYDEVAAVKNGVYLLESGSRAQLLNLSGRDIAVKLIFASGTDEVYISADGKITVEGLVDFEA